MPICMDVYKEIVGKSEHTLRLWNSEVLDDLASMVAHLTCNERMDISDLI